MLSARSVSAPRLYPRFHLNNRIVQTTQDITVKRVAVKHISYNPQGKDTPDKLNQEYVVLENMGDDAVNLAGWKLMDNTRTGERRHTYTFPEKVILQPRDEVVLHTGSGKDYDTRERQPIWNLYWGKHAFVWNDEGDTATLLDDQGKEVDSLQVVPLKES